MKLEIISPEKNIFRAENVDSLTLTTTSGIISIFSDHENLISRIASGEIEVSMHGELFHYATTDGILKVIDNEINILVDKAELAEEIDVEKAEAARLEAEKILQSKADLLDIEIARLEAVISHENARINVAKLRRKPRVQASEFQQ